LNPQILKLTETGQQIIQFKHLLSIHMRY